MVLGWGKVPYSTGTALPKCSKRRPDEFGRPGPFQIGDSVASRPPLTARKATAPRFGASTIGPPRHTERLVLGISAESSRHWLQMLHECAE